MLRETRRLSTLLTTAAACLWLAGCGTAKEETPTGPGGPPDPTATFSRVQSEIFTPRCAVTSEGGCHAGPTPQLGMSLELGKAYGNLVGVPSVETTLLRVAPGDANASYVISKIRADSNLIGDRMPFGGPYLSASQTQLITDWIRRGAPND